MPDGNALPNRGGDGKMAVATKLYNVTIYGGHFKLSAADIATTISNGNALGQDMGASIDPASRSTVIQALRSVGWSDGKITAALKKPSWLRALLGQAGQSAIPGPGIIGGTALGPAEGAGAGAATAGGASAAAGAAASAASKLGQAAAISGLIATLLDPKHILRLLLILGGGVLFVVGIIFFLKQGSKSVGPKG